jgi:sporulation protein YtfJ
MNDIPLKQIIESTLAKIGSVADVNTVVGDPITIEGGITIVPFSKVSVGFASGGVDYEGKNAAPEKAPHFAGGNGAGVSVVPLGFLLIQNGEVRMLDLKNPASFEYASQDPVSKTFTAVNSLIDKGPELVLKIKDIISKPKTDEADKTAEETETAE